MGSGSRKFVECFTNLHVKVYISDHLHLIVEKEKSFLFYAFPRRSWNRYNNNFLKFLETYDPTMLRGEKIQEGIKTDSQCNHFLLAITLKDHEYL